MIEALEAALSRQGLGTISAFDTPSALSAFREESPDAVLLAVNLGTESGVDVCKKIRGEPRGPLVPILFMGIVDAASPIRSPGDALNHGGDYFFPLPNDLDYLAGRVQGWTASPGPGQTAKPEPAAGEGVDLHLAELLDDFDQESITEHSVEPMAILKEAAAADGDDAAKELVREGEALRSAGKTREAIEVYAAAAAMYETDENPAPALALYKLILHLDPAEADVARHAGQLAVASGRKQDALDIFRRAADALEARGQLENAMFLIHEMIRIAPEDEAIGRRLEELRLALDTGGGPPPGISFDELVGREIGNVAQNTMDLAMLSSEAPSQVSDLLDGDLFDGFTSLARSDLDGEETSLRLHKPADFRSIAAANQKTVSESETHETGVPPASEAGTMESEVPEEDGEDLLSMDTLHLLRQEDRKDSSEMTTGDLDPVEEGEVIPLDRPKQRLASDLSAPEVGDPTPPPTPDELKGDFDEATFEGQPAPTRAETPAAASPEDEAPAGELDEPDESDEPNAPGESDEPGEADEADQSDQAEESDEWQEWEDPGEPDITNGDNAEEDGAWDALIDDGAADFIEEPGPSAPAEVPYGDQTQPHSLPVPEAEEEAARELRGWGSKSAEEEPLQALPVDPAAFEQRPLTMGGWSQLPVWTDAEAHPPVERKLSELPAPRYGAESLLPAQRFVPVEGTTGSLIDLVRLLAKIDQQQATGLLELAGAPRVVVVEGQPAALRGHRSVHGFLSLLLQSGKVAESACQDLMKNNQSERPVEIARLFVRHGLLREQEATVYLHRHFEDGLTVLLRQHGAWHFDGGQDTEVVREEIVPEVEDVRRLLVDLLPRIAGHRELLDAIGGPRCRIRVNTFDEESSRDARFLGVLDGRYEIEEAARLTALSPERAAAISFVYVMFGLATVVQRPKKRGRLSWIPLSQPTGDEPVLSSPPRPRAHPAERLKPEAPQGAEPAGRPSASARNESHAALSSLDPVTRLKALAGLIRSSDYFGILGVNEGASSEDVDRAHRRLVLMIDEKATSRDPELGALAREVRRSLDEARDVLANPELADAYLQHLKR